MFFVIRWLKKLLRTVSNKDLVKVRSSDNNGYWREEERHPCFPFCTQTRLSTSKMYYKNCITEDCYFPFFPSLPLQVFFLLCLHCFWHIKNQMQEKAFVFTVTLTIQLFESKFDSCVPTLTVPSVAKVLFMARLTPLPLHRTASAADFRNSPHRRQEIHYSSFPQFSSFSF